MITNDLLANVVWDSPPFNWLSSAQQVQLKDQAKPRTHKLGEVIWSTESFGSQFLVVSGNVRLVPSEGKPILLKSGDWFGDLLGLTDQWKARTASKEAVVLELLRYWARNM
jgi:signal-transduction protein with cAMP-binding, CBS, and nucleotidyltransferase domain